jgi:hypothetical protein
MLAQRQARFPVIFSQPLDVQCDREAKVATTFHLRPFLNLTGLKTLAIRDSLRPGCTASHGLPTGGAQLDPAIDGSPVIPLSRAVANVDPLGKVGLPMADDLCAETSSAIAVCSHQNAAFPTYLH